MKTDQQIYKDIAAVVNRTAPANWRTVILSAALEDDNGQVRYHYVDEMGKRNWFSPETLDKYEVYKAFDELRAMMTSQGRSWDKARLTLERTGKFGIEFDYEA